jgi:hypothetical protein
VKVKPHLQVYHLIVAKKCVSPGGPTRSMSFIDESAKLINNPTNNSSFSKIYSHEEKKKKDHPPGKPPALPVPTCVKNIPLVLFQLNLLCKKALFVFSPALKIYFA